MNAPVLRGNDAEAAARLFRLLDAMQRELSEQYDEVPAAWLLRRRPRCTPTMDAGGRA